MVDISHLSSGLLSALLCHEMIPHKYNRMIHKLSLSIKASNIIGYRIMVLITVTYCMLLILII